MNGYPVGVASTVKDQKDAATLLDGTRTRLEITYAVADGDTGNEHQATIDEGSPDHDAR